MNLKYTIRNSLLLATLILSLIFIGLSLWPRSSLAQAANFHPCNAQPALPICQHGYGKRIAVRRWQAQPEALDPDARLKAPLTTQTPAKEQKALKASSILVQDIDNDEILFSRDASEIRAIASITKLMTALVITTADLDLEEAITITSNDLNLGSEIPSRLSIGSTWTRAELLAMALTASENSAAHALARTYPGGMTEFILAMNNQAKALGMLDSKFVEPTGLSNDNVATAKDLLLLIKTSLKQPLISKYTSAPKQVIKGQTFKNTNMLVGRDQWDINLSKTGTTREAGDCLVMVTKLKDRNLAVIILNASGTNGARFGDAVRLRRIVHNNLDFK